MDGVITLECFPQFKRIVLLLLHLMSQCTTLGSHPPQFQTKSSTRRLHRISSGCHNTYPQAGKGWGLEKRDQMKINMMRVERAKDLAENSQNRDQEFLRSDLSRCHRELICHSKSTKLIAWRTYEMSLLKVGKREGWISETFRVPLKDSPLNETETDTSNLPNDVISQYTSAGPTIGSTDGKLNSSTTGKFGLRNNDKWNLTVGPMILNRKTTGSLMNDKKNLETDVSVDVIVLPEMEKDGKGKIILKKLLSISKLIFNILWNTSKSNTFFMMMMRTQIDRNSSSPALFEFIRSVRLSNCDYSSILPSLPSGCHRLFTHIPVYKKIRYFSSISTFK